MKKFPLKKISLFSLIVCEVFLLSAQSVFAKISIPSPSSVAAEMERRYHINLESVQNQSEYFNTGDNKKIAPQVMISFNPPNPKLGERITATAFPMYFNNPKESLYYTWYLQRSECKKASKGSGGYNAKCDLNEDDKVNVEDWKIEAMRLVAGNGFNPNNANYSNPQNDDDGYKAKFGGDDREKMASHCYIHDFATGINYELVDNVSGSEISCENGGTPICVGSEETVSSESFTGSGGNAFSSGNQCVNLEENPYCSGATPLCSNGTPVCSLSTEKTLSSDKSCADFFNPLSAYAPLCQQSDVSTPTFRCKHLFPNAPGEKTGDGPFGKDEEKFWQTNPEDPDTADNGNKDEANVTGLGQDNFSWNYQPGDKVGVAVEGIATTSTKYEDSSMMVMWALPKNKCKVEQTNIYTAKIKGYDVKIPITEKDLNDCLEDNLVDPREGGQSAKLDVSLSYSPENPINDSTGNNNGDELVVHSSVLNAKDRHYLKYSWEVYKSNEINPASWGNALLKSELPDVGQTIGTGLDTLKFKLNFDSPAPKFLKVKLTVSENVAEGVTNEGRTEIIIPLSSTSQKIKAYSASVSDDLLLGADKERERCAKGMDNAICPMTKNEIVALQVDGKKLTDFLWTINGEPAKPFSYQREDGKECLSGECDSQTGASTNIIYFPVLKEPGSQYTITLSASEKETGGKINLTKVFKVVDPEVKIVSSDEKTCKPVLLGHYLDLDGKTWPDLSEDNFQSLSGSIIKLRPESDAALAATNFTWYIDGIEMTADNLTLFGANIEDDGTLTFSADKNVGDFYTVAASAFYTQDTNAKKALNKYWGVQLNEFYEKQISDGIEIKLAASIDDATLAKNSTPKKVLASLFSGLPSYLNFLFRIVLTSFLLLFLSGIFFALPFNANENK